MASKIIANLLILGSGVLLRAVSQAYRQAIVNAGKTGAAQEAVNNVTRRATKVMTLPEARMILGVSEKTPWEEVLTKYQNLYDRNDKLGTFYLQSKVQRAKECLEASRRAEGQPP
eukprot:SM000047S16808  [mRNA]  locus=s47:55111:55720:+ [translate_table: standard]